MAEKNNGNHHPTPNSASPLPSSGIDQLCQLLAELQGYQRPYADWPDYAREILAVHPLDQVLAATRWALQLPDGFWKFRTRDMRALSKNLPTILQQYGKANPVATTHPVAEDPAEPSTPCPFPAPYTENDAVEALVAKLLLKPFYEGDKIHGKKAAELMRHPATYVVIQTNSRDDFRKSNTLAYMRIHPKGMEEYIPVHVVPYDGRHAVRPPASAD